MSYDDSFCCTVGTFVSGGTGVIVGGENTGLGEAIVKDNREVSATESEEMEVKQGSEGEISNGGGRRKRNYKICKNGRSKCP